MIYTEAAQLSLAPNYQNDFWRIMWH